MKNGKVLLAVAFTVIAGPMTTGCGGAPFTEAPGTADSPLVGDEGAETPDAAPTSPQDASPDVGEASAPDAPPEASAPDVGAETGTPEAAQSTVQCQPGQTCIGECQPGQNCVGECLIPGGTPMPSSRTCSGICSGTCVNP